MTAPLLPSVPYDFAPAAPETQQRKADHIRVCLEQDVQCQQITTGLEKYRFQHCCLPELGWDDLDVSSTFFGQTPGSPPADFFDDGGGQSRPG